MSTGLEIIPAALVIGAVVARRRLKNEAARAAAGEEAKVLALETQFNEPRLIIEALGEHAVERNGVLHGAVGEVPIALALDVDDELFVAYFHADLPPDEAEEALRGLHSAYHALVQRDTADRTRNPAEGSGLVFEEELVEEDGTVVISLQVVEV